MATPRLLTRKEAAAYCGVCPQVFAALCPVPTLALQLHADGTPNKRLERFDIRALDMWLDTFGQVSNPATGDDQYWLKKYDA